MAEKKATRDAYGETILALGKGTKTSWCLTPISLATRTGKFAAAFPNRHFNAGIAE
jgi:transketolase